MTAAPQNRGILYKNGLRLGIFAFMVFPLFCQAGELRACLKKIQDRDTVCRVWVIFTDKNTEMRYSVFPSRTLARRAKAGFPASSVTDAPVSLRFIREIEQSGGVLRNIFSWANAASFSIHASKLADIAAKKCVQDILPLRTSIMRVPRIDTPFLKKKANYPDSTSYGQSLMQMRIPGVLEAHDYIKNTLHQTPGDSVIIGLFDSGFRLNHGCFDYIKSHGSIIADSNFVDHTGEVSDPDSIRKAFLSTEPYSPPEEHGSQTLSLLAGYDPGKFLGVAWGARFILARTEWVGKIVKVNGQNQEIDIEVHGEEDNWAAALVWAESLGVDVISSSLAYRTEFTDSLGNLRPQDDYSFSVLNGKTTIISHAAYEATKRGMIIVNSMGNEGPAQGSVNAPADVEDVVSVGGVNSNKLIWDSSSRGPTAAGIIKPDVVTLATGLFLPDIYSPDSVAYTFGGMGTSYAAPVIAGICGLIRQTHPSDSASDIRRRLYASCNKLSQQDSVPNNIYGWGIPNALKACEIDSLTPATDFHFKIYPTALDIVRKGQHLNFQGIALADDPLHYSQRMRITIRSMSGRLVWEHSENLKGNKDIKIPLWPETQKSYAPGLYYFIVNYAGKTYTKKFIILG